MSVSDGIQSELERMRVTDLAPGLCAVALALALQMDDAGGATPASNAARELRAVMADLRTLAPAREEGDALDELNARREARRSG